MIMRISDEIYDSRMKMFFQQLDFKTFRITDPS